MTSHAASKYSLAVLPMNAAPTPFRTLWSPPVPQDILVQNHTEYGKNDVNFYDSFPSPVTATSSIAKIILKVEGDYVITITCCVIIGGTTAQYPVSDLQLINDATGLPIANRTEACRSTGTASGTVVLKDTQTWYVRVQTPEANISITPMFIVGRLDGGNTSLPLLALTESVQVSGLVSIDRYDIPPYASRTC